MADLNLAYKKMTSVLVRWFSDDPMLLHCWTLIQRVPSKTQDTIGIDSRTSPPTIKYNPNFINSLTLEQLEVIMASQGFKLLLKHCTSRFLSPKHISNLASSVTVEQHILSSAKDIIGIDKIIPKTDMFGLESDRYYEEYFRQLLDKMEEVESQIMDIWGSMSDEQKEKTVDNALGQYNKEMEEREQNKDGDGYQDIKDGSEGLKKHFDPNGNANMDWSENTLLDASITHLVNDSKGSGSMWGKFTLDCMESIVAANTPKISAYEVVKRFKTSILSGKNVPSRKKLNRRYGLAQPGYRRIYKPHIIFAIDQSGSMSEEDLADGFAIINSCCKHSKIEYILFDTQINTIVTKFKKAQKQFSRTSSGGTDFQEVIDYSNKTKADGLVIFTDGYASEPTQPNTTKVLWLLTAKEYSPPAEWGFRAYLNQHKD